MEHQKSGRVDWHGGSHERGEVPKRTMIAIGNKGSHALYAGPTISRKLCEKEPQSFSYCGSFDHLDLKSLIDYTRFFFLGLRL
jgi:hypothetical protein